METWGYEDEDQAAANLWGHGLGLAQYDPPVISRIWSLDHPVEIKEGMTFALETQHGKKFRYGVRIEEMLIVHKNEIEIVSNFPVKQITVVDPIPGYGDHLKERRRRSCRNDLRWTITSSRSTIPRRPTRTASVRRPPTLRR